MRKIAFLLSLALFVFLQFSYAQTPVSKPEQIIREDQEEEAFKEEAKWHFTSALEQLKKETVSDNDRKEAARILNEIIDCYDPDDLEAYKLLIKIYRELQDEKSKTIIEERCRAREKYLSELASEESKEVYSKDSALNTALVSLGAQDPKQRALAKKSLLAALKTNGLTAGLSAALSSRNIKRAKLAADILGEIKNPQASAALGGLLDSSSPALKLRALEALSKTGAEAGIPYFIKALSDDYYSHYEAKFRIREYASATLFGVFKEKALPLLYEAVKNEKLRWYALETLIRYSPVSAETGALLKKSLEDNNEKVVLAAIKGIEKIREQEQFL
ncbi:MAG: HEAT repeat domain-containing protein, partial [Candidatus Firestonebacteria bacterium]